MAFFRQNPAQGKSFPVERTDPEWRAGLSAEAYRVLRPGGLMLHMELPPNAQKYLKRIEETTGVPVHVISTSPDRDHTILLHHPYHA